VTLRLRRKPQPPTERPRTVHVTESPHNPLPTASFAAIAVRCPSCDMRADSAIRTVAGDLACIDCGSTFDTRRPERWRIA
jgi:hypothetical protein